MTSSIVAFIFARGGSKGLPGKNLRPLAGKPLIVRAIETGLALTRVSRVVVSTDDAEIAAVAQRAGADVPFLRPAELATDAAPEWLAWQHAIREVRGRGEAVDVFVSLPPTSPLRIPADIDCAIDLKLNSDADIVITVREAERNPYFNMVRAGAGGAMALAVEASFHRRQDAPPIYDVTTVAYVAQADFILSAMRIFDGKVRAVEVPRERAIDIDTEYDMRIAEATVSGPLGGPARVVD
ncbi:acylneuraminate cytidylyltransferase family protein [Pseudorhodoplanes sp.]|uniref:acylneuraminate cytidylyltransferase family protein n=1 Tax=Pseudorhodoplanes sp. TaxID=1934341 RepID=UPI002CC6EC0B|nr:acylneuraminate cytidylyltransferase family protein [Pseudorhodoplanes sp.]HWV40184.1 acylneuraminate cytidylyltransferase family protein [Pseudorhodoplanes sp.]